MAKHIRTVVHPLAGGRPAGGWEAMSNKSAYTVGRELSEAARQTAAEDAQRQDASRRES